VIIRNEQKESERDFEQEETKLTKVEPRSERPKSDFVFFVIFC